MTFLMSLSLWCLLGSWQSEALPTVKPNIQQVQPGDSIPSTTIGLLPPNPANPAEGPYQGRHGFGLNGGWGAPYGFGVQYTYIFAPRFDFNVGAGFSLSGFRGGVGTRFYFNETGSGPFLGANFAYTSGISGIEISFDDDLGNYELFADSALFIRGGFKKNSYRKIFLINLGYGFAFRNRGARYRGGAFNQSQQDFADLMALGGIEISASLIFKIGQWQ